MKVLIGVDDSEFSNAAVRHVAAWTWPPGARFIVMSIYTWPVLEGGENAPQAVIIEKLLGERERDTKKVAQKAAAALRKAGLSAEARVGSGDPRFVLVDTAARESADLVVIGTHGRTGVRKLLLGSVAAHVISHAPCSVLVVRPTA